MGFYLIPGIITGLLVQHQLVLILGSWIFFQIPIKKDFGEVSKGLFVFLIEKVPARLELSTLKKWTPDSRVRIVSSCSFIDKCVFLRSPL